MINWDNTQGVEKCIAENIRTKITIATDWMESNHPTQTTMISGSWSCHHQNYPNDPEASWESRLSHPLPSSCGCASSPWFQEELVIPVNKHEWTLSSSLSKDLLVLVEIIPILDLGAVTNWSKFCVRWHHKPSLRNVQKSALIFDFD